MSDERKPSDGPPEAELLRADRDLTREELGRTVAELTGKLDVKARATDKMHQTADTAREKAHHTADTAREKAQHTAETAREKAHQTAETAREKAHQTAETAREKAIEVRASAQDRAVQLTEVTRSRPAPIAAALMALIVALIAWLILRDRRNR